MRLNLLFELRILELGTKVAVYMIEVPDPFGNRTRTGIERDLSQIE